MEEELVQIINECIDKLIKELLLRTDHKYLEKMSTRQLMNLSTQVTNVMAKLYEIKNGGKKKESEIVLNQYGIPVRKTKHGLIGANSTWY